MALSAHLGHGVTWAGPAPQLIRPGGGRCRNWRVRVSEKWRPTAHLLNLKRLMLSLLMVYFKGQNGKTLVSKTTQEFEKHHL